METLVSIPLILGREQTLHIWQQPEKGFIAARQSLASGISRCGTIRVQHVPAGAPAMLDVCADEKMSHNVTSNFSDSTQTIMIQTARGEPVQIYLRWPKGSKESGLRRLHLQSGDYNINLDFDVPSVPATATHLSLADVDFVPARELIVASRSGHVSGLLPVEDVLDVSTTTGPVNLTLLPLFDKPSHASNLSLKSIKGILRVNASLDAASARAHFPSRNSSIVLQNSFGDICSVLGMARSTTVKSNIGSQWLTACLADHSRSSFTSTNDSGSQYISIVEAAAATPEEKLAGAENADERGFLCEHRSRSGRVRVSYPVSWQGMVGADSYLGNVVVTGEGIKTNKKTDEFGSLVTGINGMPLHYTQVGTRPIRSNKCLGGTKSKVVGDH